MARWLFRIKSYILSGFLGILFSIWIFAFVATLSSSVLVIVFILIYLLLVLIASEIYARRAYNRWFYEFNDGGLKLERGIMSRNLKKTLPFMAR